MAALSLLSENQLYAVSGRRTRPVRGDLLAAERPSLFRDREFQQRQREFALEEEAQAAQREGMARQEQAQREALAAQKSQQRQQVLSTAISGVGQGALVTELAAPGTFKGLATSAGILAPAAGAAPSAVATAGTTAEFGLMAAPAAGPAAAGAGTLATIAAPVAGGLAGGTIASRLPIPKGGRAAVGGVLGGAGTLGSLALLGALSGPAAPFVIAGGAILGAVTGGLCILHEAAYGPHSVEVAIARKFRDQYLSTPALRAYYQFYEPVAARMHTEPLYQQQIRTQLTDRLVRYGAAVLRIEYPAPTRQDVQVARMFIAQLEQLGEGLPPFKRANGEII